MKVNSIKYIVRRVVVESCLISFIYNKKKNTFFYKTFDFFWRYGEILNFASNQEDTSIL